MANVHVVTMHRLLTIARGRLAVGVESMKATIADIDAVLRDVENADLEAAQRALAKAARNMKKPKRGRK